MIADDTFELGIFGAGQCLSRRVATGLVDHWGVLHEGGQRSVGSRERAGEATYVFGEILRSNNVRCAEVWVPKRNDGLGRPEERRLSERRVGRGCYDLKMPSAYRAV